MTAALLISFLVFTGVTFFPAYMPTTFIVGVGLTPFKKISEYVVIGLLCAATAIYWQRMKKTEDRLLLYFLSAFIISIFSELVFAFYTRMFDTYNVLGHVYKIAAFSLIYYGIFKASVKNPYVRLEEVSERLQGEVAERKRTEEALRESRDHLEARVDQRTAELTQSNSQLRREVGERRKAERSLRTTLESIGDGFFACDGDWRFIYVNAQAERILDIRREEILGKSHWEVFPLALGTQLESEYRRAAAGEIRAFENFYKPWGRWFHNRCFPREGGGMSVYFEDITERKRMEEQLKQSEEKSRLLIKYAPSMLYEVDFYRPAFISVNDAMCQVLGYTREELLAISPLDLLDDEGKAVFRERISRFLAGEAIPGALEYKVARKDGREVYGI